MNKGFWADLKFPIVGVSPMDGVTDAAFRYISKKYGQPDVVYTEFVSVEGIWRIYKRGEMGHRIWTELKHSTEERPVVAQLFGSEPQAFYDATTIVAKMGFDGIDINMGCPSPGLEKREGGAGLIRNPERAKKVVEETRRAIEDLGLSIPVTLKTRLGSARPEPEWWEFLATLEMPVIAMHGRTFKQLYSGESNWDLLKEAGSIIRKSGTKFLANGDVKQVFLKDDEWKVRLNSEKEVSLDGLDGVLIGKNGLGNPWVYRKEEYVPTTQEKLKVMAEHAKKYEELLGPEFLGMRKHLAAYPKGFDGAQELRRKLVMSNSAKEVEEIVSESL